MAKRLTAIAVENIRPQKTRIEVSDGGCKGLYLQVQPSGARSWAFRYRYGDPGQPKKPKKLTLRAGLSLAAARKAAADAALEVEQGRDPGAAKKEARSSANTAATNTVQAVCEEYIKREGGKLRTLSQRTYLLGKHVYPTIGDRPIGAIRRSEIIRLLDKIEDTVRARPQPKGTGERTAQEVLSILRHVFAWHAIRDDDFRSPFVRGMERINAKERARTRFLSDDEIRRVWAAAGGVGTFGALVKFLLLTGARRQEAAALPWSELTGDVWVLPASRNKVKVELIRPLSRAAQEIIDKQPAIDESLFVFSYGRCPIGAFSKPKRKLDQASGVTGWVIHDLRRTARSLMSRAGVAPDVAERALGHVLPGIRAVYDQHKFTAEMRIAFEALAALVDRILDPREAHVVPLRRVASELQI